MPPAIPEGLAEAAVARPLIRSRFRVWVPNDDGRFVPSEDHDGPELIGRTSASGLTGLTPGSIVMDPAGAVYGVAADGSTYALADDSDVAAAQADATQALADAAAAQADATQGIADAASALGTAQDVGQRSDNEVANSGQIADGTTDGKLKTAVDVDTRIWGQLRTKAATDDLWDLSGKTDTLAAKYRAYWLYLDSAGAASVATADESGATDSASEAAAIAALPAWDTTKCVVGCYVAGPLTDFNGVAGLAAQGTIINGWPSAVV